MTRILRFVFLVMSTGLQASAYFLAGRVWPAAGLIVLAIPWMIGIARRWEWVSTLGLFVAFGVAAVGLLQNLPAFFLIPGAFCALLSWDLTRFYGHLCLASPQDDIAGMERRHLWRVFLLVLAGGGLSAFALTLHPKPSFGWMVVLMFLAVWGIGRVVDWLIRKEQ